MTEEAEFKSMGPAFTTFYKRERETFRVHNPYNFTLVATQISPFEGSQDFSDTANNKWKKHL